MQQKLYTTTFGIYLIRNKIDGKAYVGSAVNISGRWNTHQSALNRNKHYNPYLQKSWNKYGANNFEFIFIYPTVDKESLIEYENAFIQEFNACNTKYGYNMRITAGSFLGMKHSEETKEKMRQWNVGRKMSEESKQKMSESKKGKYLGEKGPMYGVPSPMTGKKHSEEMKKEFSRIKKEWWKINKNRMIEKGLSEKQKAKILLTGQTEDFICNETGEVFNNTVIATRHFKISNDQAIKRCLLGKQIQTCGFSFRYCSKPFIEIKRKNRKYEKFICNETKEIFDCLDSAAKKYKIAKYGIANCLYGRACSYKGYTFQFLQNPKIRNRKPKKRPSNTRTFICNETQEIFYTLGEALKRFGGKCSSCISECLRGKAKSAYGHTFSYIDEIK